MFSSIVSPLFDFLEQVFKRSGKPKSLAAYKVTLAHVDWGHEEDRSFQKCTIALEKQVSLAHHDASKRICVYTDASKKAWSGVVTEVPHVYLPKKHAEKRHEAICFLSGHFT